jgi:N-acetylglucosaminyl-diphospho-decaprenol L-rhamnosyltransferase
VTATGAIRPGARPVPAPHPQGAARGSRHDGDPPRVAVVLVTYNSADVLDDCLRSLPEGARGVALSEVVLADNASTDDSLRVAMESDVPVRIVRLERNAGYAAGLNAGLRLLDLDRVDAVLVMNPDCRLRPGCLATMAADLRTPSRGIVAPRLLNPDGTLQPTLRRMPTIRRALAEAVMGGERAGRTGRLGELVFDPAEHERAGEAAWVTGAVMLMSATCLAQVGPWDESFLLYSEETEFILRASDAGWATWYEPQAVVEHIGGASNTDPALAALLVVNKVRLFRRRHGRPATAAYYLSVLFGQAVRAAGGARTARASLVALMRPSRRIHSLAELG